MLRTELHCQSNSIDKHSQMVFAAVRHPFLPPEGVCLWELLLHHWVLNYGSIHFKVSLFVNMNLLTEWKVRLIAFLPWQVERDLMVNIRTKIMTGTKKGFCCTPSQLYGSPSLSITSLLCHTCSLEFNHPPPPTPFLLTSYYSFWHHFCTSLIPY